MKRVGIVYLGIMLGFSSLAYAAGGALSGNVKDPSGAPFKGAFVNARNAQTTLTMHVLSDPQGKYRMEGLPYGEYEVSIRAIGYRSEPKTGVKLSSETPVSLDFALSKGMVRWTDLSDHQMRELLPEGKGKEEVVGQPAAMKSTGSERLLSCGNPWATSWADRSRTSMPRTSCRT